MIEFTQEDIVNMATNLKQTQHGGSEFIVSNQTFCEIKWPHVKRLKKRIRKKEIKKYINKGN